MLAPEEVRSQAVAFARWACGGDRQSVSIDDPVYRAVTQGRHDYARRTGSPPYSSCGDLPNALRAALGIRRHVNRASSSTPRNDGDGTISGWRIGWNLVVLTRPANPYARVPKLGQRFEPGDVLVVDDGVDDTSRKDYGKTHALVVLKHSDGLLTSADYGQPGGKVCQRLISEHSGFQWLRERRVFSWLDIAAEYVGEAAAGCLESPELPPSLPPRSAPPERPTPGVLSVDRPYVTGARVRRAQEELVRRGLDCGTVDGVCGPRTVAALAAFALQELGG